MSRFVSNLFGNKIFNHLYRSCPIVTSFHCCAQVGFRSVTFMSFSLFSGIPPFFYTEKNEWEPLPILQIFKAPLYIIWNFFLISYYWLCECFQSSVPAILFFLIFNFEPQISTKLAKTPACARAEFWESDEFLCLYLPLWLLIIPTVPLALR